MSSSFFMHSLLYRRMSSIGEVIEGEQQHEINIDDGTGLLTCDIPSVYIANEATLVAAWFGANINVNCWIE